MKTEPTTKIKDPTVQKLVEAYEIRQQWHANDTIFENPPAKKDIN